MACFTCGSSGATLSPVFRSLSRAAAKYAKSKLREVKLLPTSGEWMGRTAVCARCPLYTLHEGAAYCGRPLLERPVRGAEGGCGCPIAAKARTPGEHCPVNRGMRGASDESGACDCKWCEARGLGRG